MRNFARLLFRKLKFFLVPTVILLTIAAASWWYAIPTTQVSLVNWGHIGEKTAQLAQLEKKRRLLTSVAASTLTLLSEAEKALPQEKDVASVLISIDNLSAATQQGVDSIDLSPGIVSSPAAEAPSVSNTSSDANIRNDAFFLPIHLNTRGTTDQFSEFVRQLTASRRLFDIAQINITYLQGEADFLTANFIVDAYYLPPITEIGSIDDPLPEFTAQEKSVLASLTAMPYVSIYTGVSSELGGAIPIGKVNLFAP